MEGTQDMRRLLAWLQHDTEPGMMPTPLPAPTSSSSLEQWRTYLEYLDAAPLSRRTRSVDERRFVALVQALEERLGYPCPYEVGRPLQDEAVYGDMLVPAAVLREDYLVRVRASDTGNLVTVYDWDGAVQPEPLKLIIATVEEFGYLYVPSAVLNTPYTGRWPPPEPPTWSERFFGYL